MLQQPVYDGYIKFLLRKTLGEILKHTPNVDEKTVNRLFNYLISSHNILKDIYLISQVQKLENFGNYLLFVCQKLKQGEISFDNLSQNITGDADFLKQEVFKVIGYEPGDRETLDAVKEESKPRITPPGKQEDPDSIIQGKFHIQEIENEIVTEEFTESYLGEETSAETGKQGYLELIQNEEGVPEDVFILPGHEREASFEEEPEEKAESETEDAKEEIVEEIKEEETIISGMFDEDMASGDEPDNEQDSENENMIEENRMTSLVNELIEDEIFSSENAEDEEELNALSAEDINNEEKADEEKEEYTAEYEEDAHTEPVFEPNKTPVNEEISNFTDASRPKTNKAYLEYETGLFAVNLQLREIFTLFEKNANITDNSIQAVLQKSSYMEGYSREMSFELISGVYSSIHNYFDAINEGVIDIEAQHLLLLNSGLTLIESLIKDQDYLEFDEVIKKLEDLNTFIEQKETGISETEPEPGLTEEARAEEITEEIKLPERYSDRSYQENIRILKKKILELEKLFSDLDLIKGYYKNYEGLRRLSNTFKIFKEFVRISKGLDLPKLAQLSEASYIFIKFLQNYRLDPFDKEVKDILKYIIYNFKLVALDKPTKDLDVFVSYLNDPVKIFTQTQKTQK